MSVVLAAAIGGAAGNAVLLVAGLVYLRVTRVRARRRRLEFLKRYESGASGKIEIRIPPGDTAFREWLKKAIRTQGGPPKPGQGAV